MTMKQVLFNYGNLDKYYLSPYVEVTIKRGRIRFVSLLTTKTLIVTVKRPEILLDKLKQGVAFDELCVYLQEELQEVNPEGWIATLFQHKILE